ncbi:type II toxin-antitoxin system RelE/ParE family toxin [Paenibacillus sp. CF384]|uniref:type II toxin-antitoxin system RelE/ParE family toxin n=1 Tax=Paenibacillus sp. CF384 TaxID=1884382 RepID=UPI00089A927F|nr:type II toxin-antitoxin system RelE/ParE family toxin [Paenibacillus sp. CF384]SDX26064.1 Phage derived protein Gp49-like [Paenibacillus sp. CF384]
MYQIRLYTDIHERSPFQDSLAELDKAAASDKHARGFRKKINYCIEILRIGGTRAGEKFTKQIEEKLWELRIDDHRAFFFLSERL